jgi:hypothetical protein
MMEVPPLQMDMYWYSMIALSRQILWNTGETWFLKSRHRSSCLPLNASATLVPRILPAKPGTAGMKTITLKASPRVAARRIRLTIAYDEKQDISRVGHDQFDF